MVDFKNFNEEQQLQSQHISILKQENHVIKTLIEEKVHNSQANHLKNKSVKHVVSLLGKRKVIGIEELLQKQDTRQNTVTCYSFEAQTYFIPRDKFLALVDQFKLQKNISLELDFNKQQNAERI